MTAAPLHSLPDAPLDGTAEWIEARDGARLRVALFPARGRPRGSVVVSPGRTEPIEKYAEVIGELQARGFTALVHDWRGQGLSERFRHARLGPDGVAKGHARGWRLFLSDLSCVLDACTNRLPRPWIALSHSMGGCLTLLALSEGERRFDGAILGAPMLGLRLGGRPKLLVTAVTTLMTLIGRGGDPTPPASPRPHKADYRDEGVFTHDEARWDRFQALLAQAPELQLGEQTWSWLQFALIATRRLEVMRTLERVNTPVVIVGAGRDRVVKLGPQRAAAARLPRGRYVEVADAYHELLLETDDRRAVFWRAFDDLAETVGARPLDEVSPPPPQAAAAPPPGRRDRQRPAPDRHARLSAGRASRS